MVNSGGGMLPHRAFGNVYMEEQFLLLPYSCGVSVGECHWFYGQDSGILNILQYLRWPCLMKNCPTQNPSSTFFLPFIRNMDPHSKGSKYLKQQNSGKPITGYLNDFSKETTKQKLPSKF